MPLDEHGSELPDPTVVHARPNPWVGGLVIAIAVAATIAGWLGNVVFPSLVHEHPLALTILSPADAYLLLVSNSLSAWTFYALAFTRRFLPIMAWVLLGRWYSDATLRWVEQRTGELRAVRVLERWFKRAAWPLLVVWPAPIVAVLAGASEMSLAGVVLFVALGQWLRLVAIRGLGWLLGGVINDLVHWIDRARWPLVGLMVVIVGIATFRDMPRRMAALEQFTEAVEAGESGGAGETGDDPKAADDMPGTEEPEGPGALPKRTQGAGGSLQAE